MTKPTQGVAFNRFRDQLMEVTESQDPCPGNAKTYREDKLSKNGQNAISNTAPGHKSVWSEGR